MNANYVAADTAINPEDEKAFAVFASAVDRYITTLDESTATAFELWLEEHVADEDLLAHLVQTHPKFAEVFTDEIEKAAVAKPMT